MKHSFSTAKRRDDDAVEGWRSWLANELHPVDVVGYDADRFHADCDIMPVGDIKAVTFRGSPQSFVRQQAAIRLSHSDDYVVSALGTGPCAFDHNGYNVKCRDGDIILIDTGRPYTIAHKANIRVLSVVIPRRHLESRLGATNTAVGLCLDGRSPMPHIIRSFLRRLTRNAETLESSAADRLSSIAVDLIAAGFDERLARDEPFRNRQSTTIARAQAFIDDNLSDHDLDISHVAAFLRMSSRRLYEIFAREEMSVMEYIWERRLLRAEKLLMSDARRLMPISAIAYRAGFKSTAHFARRFRKRFGVSATDLREQLRSR